MLIDEGLELLDDDQCLELLRSGKVGRVGLTIGAMPAIFPVNYMLVDGWIVYLTSHGTKLSAAAEGTIVAFEVDDYDPARRSGWSVLAVGPSEVVVDPQPSLQVRIARLVPYAIGPRTTIIRIRPELLSGRRVLPLVDCLPAG